VRVKWKREPHEGFSGFRLTLLLGRFKILSPHKLCGEKMAKKDQRSKSGSLPPIKTLRPEDKFGAARKTLFDMREKLLAEGLGKSLPEDLARPFDIGDEGDRADIERSHEVSILISARDKEKLLAIEDAVERIREGTYGVCEECGDEIGSGRLKAMPLAKLCVSCQSRIEKETEHQKFAREEMGQEELISEAPEE